MQPIKQTPLWIQRIRWTCRGLKPRWPLDPTKVMPRPEKTVRYPIHLNPRNKAPRGRSAAMMDRPIGCKSLVEHMFRHSLKLIIRKSCWSGGNALTLKSQTRISLTSKDNIHCSMENHNRLSKCISFAPSIHRQPTWESDRWKRSIVQRTTSLLSKVATDLAQAVKNTDSGSKTDPTVCRKFSRSMSKKATNQRLFS